MPNEEPKDVVQELQANMTTLRGMADSLCASFEAQTQRLLAEKVNLSADRLKLQETSAELDQREQKVARREQEVMNIRQIAADRKTQLETAKQNADAAEAARRKAEISQRMAETEKTKLEETVAILLADKKALIQGIGLLHSKLNTAANMDEAIVAAKSL